MSRRKFRSFLESVKKYDPTLVNAIMEAEEEIFGNEKEKTYKVGDYEFTYDQLVGNEKIKGDLHMGLVDSIPKGFSPNVDGDLWLGQLRLIPEGFSPTVSGDLDISRVRNIQGGSVRPLVGICI